MRRIGELGPRLLGPHLINGAAGIPLGGPGLPIALVDVGDYANLSQHVWRVLTRRGCRYAIRKTPDSGMLMHRQLLQSPSGRATDHINGDGLDNRRANLRVCTQAENCANKKKHHRSANARARSRYKGVTANGRKFVATCGENGYLGNFPTEEAAARAYDDAARARWGEFARLNFPRAGEQGALAEEAA